ncbi:MAG TPA: hypothetical protein VFM84_04065, partial [Holophagaceae bacterium]|nr:hypothetical protein [Holophagaceae bacterium]
QTLIVGMDNLRHEVILLSSTPYLLPQNPTYGDIDLWLPLSGGRILSWDSVGARDCNILEVSVLESDQFSGFQTTEGLWKSLDLASASDREQLKPYEFQADPRFGDGFTLTRSGKRFCLGQTSFFTWK